MTWETIEIEQLVPHVLCDQGSLLCILSWLAVIRDMALWVFIYGSVT
uniref:Uncharacterized protein n=1 Tax=Rhizophora mucronata TaxID=61149 RepID=A0A2P2QNP3_RHIMU